MSRVKKKKKNRKTFPATKKRTGSLSLSTFRRCSINTIVENCRCFTPIRIVREAHLGRKACYLSVRRRGRIRSRGACRGRLGYLDVMCADQEPMVFMEVQHYRCRRYRYSAAQRRLVQASRSIDVDSHYAPMMIMMMMMMMVVVIGVCCCFSHCGCVVDLPHLRVDLVITAAVVCCRWWC